MPVLHEYADGDGYFIRVGFGEGEVGTWQIGPEGLRWLQSNQRVKPDGSFSRADFAHLKQRGLVVNGGRPLSGGRRPNQRCADVLLKRLPVKGGIATITTVTRVTTDDAGNTKRVHDVQILSVEKAKRATDGTKKKRPKKQKRLRPLNTLRAQENSYEKRSHTPSRGTGIECQVREQAGRSMPGNSFQPFSEVRQPRLFFVPGQDLTFSLSILLPGYLQWPGLGRVIAHQRTELVIDGARTSVFIEKLEGRNGHIHVLPLERTLAIRLRQPALHHDAYRLWTCGCPGLNTGGTVFAGNGLGVRLGDGARVRPGGRYTLVWRRGMPSPPWEVAEEKMRSCASDKNVLAAHIVLPEQPTMEQRWWLGDAGVVFSPSSSS